MRVEQNRTLVILPHGSFLYGTQGPESDMDVKGVFVPSRRELLLCRVPRQVAFGPSKGDGEKNKAGDEERVYFAAHEFIRMALEGQTLAIDLLFAHPSTWIYSTDPWKELAANKHRFLTRNLNAFIGYAKRQANKYGMKGSRLETARWAVEELKKRNDRTVSSVAQEILQKAWDDGIQHVASWVEGGLDILGRYLTPGAVCGHYVDSMEKYYRSYGERARMAESSEGVDWKAMMHAVRAAIMVENILLKKDWSLPFDRDTALYLRSIKLGTFAFTVVLKDLEDRIDSCQRLSETSDLPVSGDVAWAEDWVIGTTKRWSF